MGKELPSNPIKRIPPPPYEGDMSDLTNIYITEAGALPPLTRPAQIQIDHIIFAGRRAQTRLRLTPLLSAEEEEYLKMQLVEESYARDILILTNTRLAISKARQSQRADVDLLDLMQGAVLGLTIASRKYDPAHRNKFSSYAYWWIRNGIQDTIKDQVTLARLPERLTTRSREFKKKISDFENAFGRSPTDQEIAAMSIYSPGKLVELRNLENYYSPVAIDDDLPSPVEPELSHDFIDVISQFVDKRAVAILMLRLGIDSGAPHSLREVGKMVGLSQQGVAYVVNKTLSSLRQPDVRDSLK